MEHSKDDVPTYYTNSINIQMSLHDILFRVGQIEPIQNDETKKVEPKLREEFKLFMSPQHFKSLVVIMNQHLEKYEQSFGELNLTATESEKKHE